MVVITSVVVVTTKLLFGMNDCILICSVGMDDLLLMLEILHVCVDTCICNLTCLWAWTGNGYFQFQQIDS